MYGDLFVFIAYIIIPLEIIYIRYKTRNVKLYNEHVQLILLFVSFILCCGITHLNNFISPNGTWNEFNVWLTAVVSLLTAFVFGYIRKNIVNTILTTVDVYEKVLLATKEKTLFMGFICHEVRNAIQTITLINEQYPSKRKETIEKICNRIKMLMTDSLTLLKTNKGTININEEVTDIIKYTKTLQEEYSNVKVESFLPQELYLNIDINKVGNILSNLITNSIKYSKGDTTVSFHYVDYILRIEVTDNGVGIPQEILKSLFKPFVVHKRFRNDAGSGLGLSICKRISDIISDCNLYLQYSDKQCGTKFCLELTREPIFDNNSIIIDLPELKHNDIKSILVVDDNEVLVELFVDMLHSIDSNIHVDYCYDGKTAVEKANEKPDLIFMDYHMPYMNGIEAINQIKKQYNPIIVLVTGEMDIPEKINVDYYLEKPFTLKNIKEILNEQVARTIE